MINRADTARTTRRKILVYLIGSLGDSIVAIPSLRAVRRHFGEAEIVLLQNRHSAAVVTADEVLPSGLVDRSLAYASSSRTAGSRWLTFVNLWRAIRTERFDAAVSLVISERPASSMRRDRFFFRSCGISQLLGFEPHGLDYLYPVDETGYPAATDQEAVRKLKRLAADGIAVEHADLEGLYYAFGDAETRPVRAWLGSRRLRPDAPLVAIAPGCKTKANQWPLENFHRLARDIVAASGCEIIIVGGPAEKADAASLVERAGSGIAAAGEFSVMESAMLLAECDLYIGLDTGSTHLAAAVGTPYVAIFGERNNPGQWYPLGAPGLILRHKVPCAGCRLFECPVAGHPCVNGISPAEVLMAAKRMLGSKGDRPAGPTVKEI